MVLGLRGLVGHNVFYSSRRRGRMSGALSGVAETCQPVNRSTSKRVNQETSQSEPVLQNIQTKYAAIGSGTVHHDIQTK